MSKTLSILLVVLPIFCKAQKQGNVWYFGKQAGLDFNTTPPTPLLNGQTYLYPAGWNEGSSTISDSSGSLLLYSNGMKIWNKQHQVMPNGDGLLGHVSSVEPCIIVPQPGSSQYFYVFTTDAWENNFQNGLRYSVVDICLDSGKGDVISTKKNIKILDTVAERLICIPHLNGTDYWIVTHKFNSDVYYSFRLTSSGLVDTVVSYTGNIDPQGWGGQMVASPNGQKIAYAIPNAQSFGKTFIADFDANMGIVSNELILSTGGREYGVAFSQNSSKLYFSTSGFGEVFQYDLTVGNLSAIIASKTYIVQAGPDSWREMRLGPDGKIYLSRTGKSYLCVIQSPNSLCPACNYIDSAIYLGGKTASFGLPNFIAGYDYSNEAYMCPAGIDELNEGVGITLFPNPSTGSFTIQTNNAVKVTGIEIFNVMQERIQIGSKQLAVGKNSQVDLSQQTEGVYFVRVHTGAGVVNRKIIVVR